MQKFNDAARAALTGNISAAATSLAVTAGLADLFPVSNTADWGAPADWFKVLIMDALGNREVVKVGTRAAGSGAFTNLLRAQDGTTALSWNAGAAVVHGPLAADFQNCLAGVFGFIASHDAVDPKHEMAKTGVAAAMWHLVDGKMTLAQSDGSGNVVADRFTFDQTSGTFTAAGFTLTSDERLKTNWRGMGRNFIARLADVKAGLYRRRGGRRLEVGVSAQSLREVMPQAVQEGGDGYLSVAYANAALVAAVHLARDNVDLRAELADLRERIKRLERAK